MKKKVSFIILPRGMSKREISEKKEFWAAQWHARNRFYDNSMINESENGLVPFDQPEVPYTGVYILSFLTEWDVDIVDLHACLDENGKVKKNDVTEIIKYKSENILLFSPFTNNYNLSVDILNIIKSISPNTICIIGGVHVSALPLESLNNGFDYVVSGQGEIFLNAFNYIKKEIEIRNLPNVHYIHGGKYYISKNLNYNYSYKTNKLSYKLIPSSHRKSYYTRLFTIFGCPFKCSFCSNILWNKMSALYKPYNLIQHELNEINEYINYEEIYVNDETFTINKEHSKRVATLLKDRKIKWGCETRVDKIDMEIVKYFAECGCEEIDFGIESFDENILRLANKKINQEQIINALEITSSYNIRTHANIMIGLPGETETSAIKTINKVSELIEKKLINTVDYFVLVPYPGTPIFNAPEKYGMKIISKNWDLYREDEQPVFEYQHLNSERIFELWLYGLKQISKTIINRN
ncbi:MAG: radical SAM protein [Ignavibacteriales bacterium]|nr:radical SAM protein [Ignavibacteriales bacterium]MCF8315750.1 radical SAM protein [Ignavibacteriales bacterium]MCF8437056.1 radical SAM protein [Ignavibacteriales bacterium]